MQKLDVELRKFAQRRLDEDYPYLILEARYEKVRENGVVRSRAVQVAIGINADGLRCVLGVESANRESGSSWQAFLIGLKERGLRGVELVIGDNHEGLKQAIREVLCKAVWRRSCVHFLFLRDALGHLPRKDAADGMQELAAVDPGAGGGTARGTAGGNALPEYGRTQGAQRATTAAKRPGRVTSGDLKRGEHPPLVPLHQTQTGKENRERQERYQKPIYRT